MNPRQAKEILSVYRPGTADDHDPEFAGALACLQQDAALRDWFAGHCAVQQTLRARFRKIAVPEGLKEQIISEHRAWLAHQRWRRPAAIAAVAVVITVLVAVAVFWLQPVGHPKDEVSLATFRSRMVRAVLRQYTMTLETNNLDQIRAHLGQNQAPADYVLPKALNRTESTGCGVLGWQGQRVSMVCFHSGKPLPAGEKTDMFLFIVDRSALPDAPPEDTPQFAKVNRLVTASWSHQQRVYVLAMEGDAASIRTYFD